MKKFKVSLIICTFLIICGTACKKAKEEKPLNVIILIVDDMGYGDIAAHGNPIIKTPHFDSMYEHGVRFTNFGVSPTCAPTRAALLTGKHEFLTGVTHTIEPMRNMDAEATTIADLFQKKAYKTGLFGKWHLGQKDKHGPWFQGFDETLTVPGDVQNSHFDPVLLKNRTEIKYDGYREDILFDEAMDFITDHKDSAFFCYLATYSPHAPNVVPEKYSEPYEDYAEHIEPDCVYKAAFNGQIANVDENLGRLKAHLEALGLVKNTLLIVMGDNGGTWGVDTYNAGMRGIKGTPWYGGSRVFSFWEWGDHLPSGERKQMTGHIDILPTLADFCNLNIPPALQSQLKGNSLRPVLEKPNAKLDKGRMQIHHLGRWYIPENWADHKYAGCAVRWKNYILVRNEPCNDINCSTCFHALARGRNQRKALYTCKNEHYALTAPGEWELYNIESDPFQEHNIAAENPEIVKKMSDYYEKWWVKVEDEMKARW
ncbi:MAG: arylsulfatase [Bacteroidota bacterium]